MLIVSPHLDDAALSCIRHLVAAPVPTVVTVFAGVPPQDAAPNDWEVLTRARLPAERAHTRRSEDAAAWASLGVPFVHLDLHEHLQRSALPQSVATVLRPLLAAHDTWLIPAGIGGHPDHVLVRDICLAALPPAATATLYGELPYAAYYGWPDAHAYLNVESYWRLAVAGVAAMGEVGPPRLTQLNPLLRAAKRRLLEFYPTQLAAVGAGSLDLLGTTGLLNYELEFAFRKAGGP